MKIRYKKPSHVRAEEYLRKRFNVARFSHYFYVMDVGDKNACTIMLQYNLLQKRKNKHKFSGNKIIEKAKRTGSAYCYCRKFADRTISCAISLDYLTMKNFKPKNFLCTFYHELGHYVFFRFANVIEQNNLLQINYNDNINREIYADMFMLSSLINKHHFINPVKVALDDAKSMTSFKFHRNACLSPYNSSYLHSNNGKYFIHLLYRYNRELNNSDTNELDIRINVIKSRIMWEDESKLYPMISEII